MKTRTLQHENQIIPYEIQHKPTVTRRIHLRAGPDGMLLVIAPKRMSKRVIHKTLQERVRKVVRFLADAMDKLREIPRYHYLVGEEHLYLGQPHRLEFVTATSRRGSVCLSEGKIRISNADHSPDSIKRRLESWYRKRAADHFDARIKSIAENAMWINGEPPPLRLRKMKRTWGSCSAHGVMTLNTRLIKTPQACIDYVIAHELCHLREMNHGKAFYALQKELYPGWREARDHLRDKAHIYLHE